MSLPTLQYSRRRSILRSGRLWRGLFHLVTVVSLMLAIGAALCLHRSRTAMDLVSFTKGDLGLDLAAPDRGLMFFFENDALPASLFYRPGKTLTITGPLRCHYEKIDYPDPGFRDDLAAWSVAARYHPFFYGHVDSGKFDRFDVEQATPPALRGPAFGWGMIIPVRYAILFFSILPALWLLSFTASRFKRGPVPFYHPML